MRGVAFEGARSADRLVRAGGRVLLWACVGVVLVRGIATIVSDPPASERPSQREARVSVWPDADARAFATRFARTYLTFSPGRPDEWRRVVAGFVSDELSDRMAPVGLPSHGPRRGVALATVAREVSLGGSRALITVAVTSTDGDVRYLAVPIARDRHRGLVVFDAPSFVAPPPRGSAHVSEPEPLTGPDAGVVSDLVRRFLTAYVSGEGGSQLTGLLAPGTRLAQMPSGLEVLSVDEIAHDPAAPDSAGVAVVAAVRVRDQHSGARYALRYRLRVVRDGHWYVSAVVGGPNR